MPNVCQMFASGSREIPGHLALKCKEEGANNDYRQAGFSLEINITRGRNGNTL